MTQNDNDNKAIGRYVFPLLREPDNERSFAGTAFLIDGYLVTAGHVIDHNNTYYLYTGGHSYPLAWENWIPKQLPAESKLEWDVAMYPTEGLPSPLTWADDEVEQGDELELVCWQMMPGGKIQQVKSSCLCLGRGEEDGYLRMSTVQPITHGASGCPVFRGDKLYGILTMGRDYYELPQGLTGYTPATIQLRQRLEKNTCWVFKTSYIRRFLPQK